MYQEKMVVCLKSNDGKIIRDKNGEVKLPFGSEYSILIKNMESRKAKIKIEIDGEDVLDGNSLLINPNDSIELEGFMKNNVAKNSFRFIEKTSEISDFRGDKPEDGLIKVSWQWEKIKPITQKFNYEYDWLYRPNQITYLYPTWVSTPDYSTINCGSTSTVSCSNNINTNVLRSSSVGLDNFSVSSCTLDSFNDNGITVKGTQVNQEFQYGYIGELEENIHTIVLKLSGINNIGNKVEKVVCIKDKLQCKTCGKISGSNANFCDRCGTYLE
jgi:hypothetical protein